MAIRIVGSTAKSIPAQCGWHAAERADTSVPVQQVSAAQSIESNNSTGRLRQLLATQNDEICRETTRVGAALLGAW